MKGAICQSPRREGGVHYISYSGALHVRGHVGATQAANSRNVHEEARQLPSRLAVLVQEIRRVLSAG